MHFLNKINTFGNIVGKTVHDEYQNRKNNTIPKQLTNAHPKTSEEMMALGQVNFGGKAETPEQIAYTPDDIAGFFSSDSAPTEYAYSSIQEDVATLFDAAMMSARYAIERDEAVANPRVEGESGHSIKVFWGQRGRVADPAVLPRAKFVFERIMPELDTEAFFAKIPAVRSLTVGASWWNSVELGASASPRKARSVSQDGISRVRPIEDDLIRKYK